MLYGARCDIMNEKDNDRREYSGGYYLVCCVVLSCLNSDPMIAYPTRGTVRCC